MPKAPKTIHRKVMKVEYCRASRYTGYKNKSVRLILKCGHDRYQKASRHISGHARCVTCERAK